MLSKCSNSKTSEKGNRLIEISVGYKEDFGNRPHEK